MSDPRRRAASVQAPHCGLTAILLVLSSALLAGQQVSQNSDGASVEALLGRGLYQAAEDRARLEFVRSTTTGRFHGPERTEASSWLVRAMFLNGRGSTSKALELAQGVLSAEESRRGPGDVALAPLLLDLSDVLLEVAELERARQVAGRAVTLLESTGKAFHIAVALDRLGRAHSAAGHHDDALAVLQRGLRLKEDSVGSTSVSTATTLEEIGLAWQRKGDYDNAGPPLRRAASIQEGTDPAHPRFATTLNLLAQQLWFQGQLFESKRVSERALAVARAGLRPDHPTVALSLRYLAATLANIGEAKRASDLKLEALAIAEGNFGANHHLTAVFLNALAVAERDGGNYANARRLFQRVLSIFNARYGPNHEFVATTWSNLAKTSLMLGDYPTARREQEHALAIRTRVGPNHPYVAVALTELAQTLRQQGLTSRALPLLERALAIRETQLGAGHRDVAQTLAELAATLLGLGRQAEALDLAKRAIAIWEGLKAPDAPEFARVLVLFGEIQSNRGDHTAARHAFERAMRIRERVFGASNPVIAEAQSALAQSLARTGDWNASINAAISAEATGREHLRLMLRSLPERQALEYAAVRPRGMSLLLSLATNSERARTAGFDVVVRSRALVLDEIAARRAVSAGEIVTPARTAWVATQQRLADLMVRGPGPLGPAEYAAILGEARRGNELAEQVLAEQSAEFRALRSRSLVGAPKVGEALPTDAALVSFVRYDHTSFDAGGSDPRRRLPQAQATGPAYLAFVLRKGRQPIAVPLGPAAFTDRLVSRWRTDIAAEAVQTPSAGNPTVRSSRVSGTALRRRVWDAISPHLTGVARVFIVPDGTLSLVPFAALPAPVDTYLLETGPILHYLSAERDLANSAEGALGEGLLAVGGPAFDAAARTPAAKASLVRAAGPEPCGDFQAATFQPLRGTLRELQDVSAAWSESHSATGPIRLLTGVEANETAFKAAAPKFRVVHLATHGFFLGTCQPSIVSTRAVGGLVTAGSRRERSNDSPLRLSGLALSGANRRAFARADEDDGILTSEEVASLDLSGVQWAVLSACDTGLGEIRAGEGVLGLRRAFRVAGARTVIMSLWSVEDRSAREWMRSLYDGRFRAGLDTAHAVHNATLSVLRARRAKGQSTHPFYWAAFVAAGDWR